MVTAGENRFNAAKSSTSNNVQELVQLLARRYVASMDDAEEQRCAKEYSSAAKP